MTKCTNMTHIWVSTEASVTSPGGQLEMKEQCKKCSANRKVLIVEYKS